MCFSLTTVALPFSFADSSKNFYSATVAKQIFTVKLIFLLALIFSLCYFLTNMSKKNHNTDGYTTAEAANLVGVSSARIRQLALAGEIEHKYFGRSIVVTELGITQAKARRKTVGRPAADKPGDKKAA